MKKRKRSSFDGSDLGGEDDVVGGTPGSSSAAKKAVKFPRGKKCAVAVGRADPDVDRTPIELPYTCDGCHNYILGTRYNCGGCEDFDVCEQCFRKYQDGGDPDLVHEHPPSVFIAVPSAEDEEAAADAKAKSGPAPGAAGTGRGAEDDAAEGGCARGDAALRMRAEELRARAAPRAVPPCGSAPRGDQAY